MASDIVSALKKHNLESDIFHLNPSINHEFDINNPKKPAKNYNLITKPRNKLDKFININFNNGKNLYNGNKDYSKNTNSNINLYKKYRNYGIMKGGKKMFDNINNSNDHISLKANDKSNTKEYGLKCNSSLYYNQTIDHIGPNMDCSIDCEDNCNKSNIYNNDDIEDSITDYKFKSIENKRRFKRLFNNSNNVKRLLNNSYDNLHMNKEDIIEDTYNDKKIRKIHKNNSFDDANYSIMDNGKSIVNNRKNSQNYLRNDNISSKSIDAISIKYRKNNNRINSIKSNDSIECLKSIDNNRTRKFHRFSTAQTIKNKASSTKNIHNSNKSVYIPSYLKMKKENRKTNANIELCKKNWCNSNNEAYINKFYPDKTQFNAKERKILDNQGCICFTNEGTIQKEYNDREDIDKNNIFLNISLNITAPDKIPDESAINKKTLVKQMYMKSPLSVLNKQLNNISVLSSEEFYEKTKEKSYLNKDKPNNKSIENNRNYPREKTREINFPNIKYDDIINIKKVLQKNGLHAFGDKVAEVDVEEKMNIQNNNESIYKSRGKNTNKNINKKEDNNNDNRVKLELKVRQNTNDKGFEKRLNSALSSLKSNFSIKSYENTSNVLIQNNNSKKPLKKSLIKHNKAPNFPSNASYVLPNSSLYNRGIFEKTRNPVKNNKVIYNKENREYFGNDIFRKQTKNISKKYRAVSTISKNNKK